MCDLIPAVCNSLRDVEVFSRMANDRQLRRERAVRSGSHCAAKTCWESLTSCIPVIGWLHERSSVRERDVWDVDVWGVGVGYAVSCYTRIRISLNKREPRSGEMVGGGWINIYGPGRHSVFGGASAHLLARASIKAASRKIATRPMEHGNGLRDFRRILTSHGGGGSAFDVQQVHGGLPGE